MKTTIYILNLLAPILIAASPATTRTTAAWDEKALDLYYQGARHYSEGKYDEASDDFETAVELAPDFSWAYNAHGSVLIKMAGDLIGEARYKEADKFLIKALKKINRAVDLDETYAAAYYNKGLVYFKLRRFSDAARYFERAVELAPDDPAAHEHLGYALYYLPAADEASIERAVSQWRQAVELAPQNPHNAAIYVNIGRAHYLTGRIEAAIREYEKALAIDSDYIETCYAMGQALETMGRIEQAIEWHEKALAINAAFVPARQSLADIQLVEGDLMESLRTYYQIIDRDSTNCRIYLRITQLLDILADQLYHGRNRVFHVAKKLGLDRSHYLYGDPYDNTSAEQWNSAFIAYADDILKSPDKRSRCRYFIDSFFVPGLIEYALNDHYLAVKIDKYSPRPYYNLAVDLDLLKNAVLYLRSRILSDAEKYGRNCRLPASRIPPTIDSAAGSK